MSESKSGDNCETLKKYYEDTEEIDKTSEKYNEHLKCLSEKNKRELASIDDVSLYPHLDDSKFNQKLYLKKEFNEVKYDKKSKNDFDNIIDLTNKICTTKEFELQPHQMFVRNFLSFQTPYNGLLLFHGLGTGKTCSAISVCEEMRRYNKQLGVSKKIIIVASPAVQENFKLQLFDERKLKEINGLWNIKACTGNSFLKEVNPMNMKGLSRKKIVKNISKIVRQSYVFYGYGEFSNHLKKIMNKNITEEDDENNIKIKQEKSIKKEFSNRLIVIDEIHNLRVSTSGLGNVREKKESSKNIEKLALYAENLKMMILSATPMFNSHKEIVWLLNILNMNDNRYRISIEEVFDKRGDFILTDDYSGKELLMEKATGYVSYVRGENPFTFPNRIWPKYSMNENSLLLKNESGVWNYPEKQLNDSVIAEPIEILDLVTTNIGEIQFDIYNRLINFLKKENPSLNDPKKNIGFTKLEAPLQCLNMSYPHKKIDEDEDLIRDCYGKRGLSRLMLFKPKTKSKFNYKDSTLRDFGRIFSPEEIGKYSGKIKNICDYIKKSKGLVFIFSQYIDSGAIPIALALEEMGFSRNSKSNLFERQEVAPVDYITLKPITKDSKIKIKAKYAMITGNRHLTPNLKKELKLVTDPENVDGKQIKVIIVTRAGSEGLDFSFIRQMHILDPWYNMNRTEQIIGRAVRNKSHCLLPYIERNVEIFLYCTLLPLSIESADLYVYRLAEKKAKKIGVVTRALKECAIDCLLNREGLDFSVDIMNKVVQQKLSSGIEIDFKLGDKENSAVCDYNTCNYKCSVSKPNEEINKDTYNEGFIIMNLDKILQRIRVSFKEKYIYKKDELIQTINTLKKYPLDQINSGLDYLINEKNEYIVDTLGRLGRLVNINDYYMFQPMEIKNKNLSYYERTHPVDFKRKKLKFKLDKNIKEVEYYSDSDFESDMDEDDGDGGGESKIKKKSKRKEKRIYNQLLKDYNNIIEPQEIKSSEKEIWSKSAGWAVYNLNNYNDLDKDMLVNLSMYHIIDTLKYMDKVKLLNYIYSKDQDSLNNLEKICKNFFRKFQLSHPDGTRGIILINYNNKSQYKLLTLEGNVWKDNGRNIKKLLVLAMNQFQIIDDSKINNFVGFISDFKKDIVFKIKDLGLTSKNRKSKGKRCDRSGSKKSILNRINILLDPAEEVKKYECPKNEIKRINNITDREKLLQIPEKFKDEEPKTRKHIVRINALQLCIETELILRYYNEPLHKKTDSSDLTTKNNKIWFFNTVEAIINDITNKIKKQ
jgi:hypothetical protein|uniref:Helicase C-terminal domain-containing protein n=1 Tax=viral metagenome TaxID=1070528 RepID=A0A6C0BZU7_9ZZZZ